jgi:hypothetical protein
MRALIRPMKDEMFKRITKSIGEKQIIFAFKVPQGYKINCKMTVFETDGKKKMAEDSGLVCCYDE